MKKLCTLSISLFLIALVISACSKGGSNVVKPPPVVTKTPTQKLLATGTWKTTSDTLGSSIIENSNFGVLAVNTFKLTPVSTDGSTGTFVSSRGSGTYVLLYDNYQGQSILFSIEFKYSSGENDIFGIDSVNATTLDINQIGTALPDPHGTATTYTKIAQQLTLTN